jgi:prepilin-type N-terminal cleavage/methylation domain-containing protein
VRDEGMTLTELLVTMFVTSIVITATVTLVTGVQRTNSENLNRQTQVDQARVGTERVIKTLRTSVMQSQLGCASCTADAFIQGQDFRVQFYANIDNPGNSVGPSKVTYDIVPSGPGVGTLRETIQKPDSPTPTAAGYLYTNTANIVTSNVAFDIRTDTGAPMFEYYDGSSARLVPSGGALTSGQLANVLAMEVRITVQAPGGYQAKPTTYIQRAMLPNAEAVVRQSDEGSTP